MSGEYWEDRDMEHRRYEEVRMGKRSQSKKNTLTDLRSLETLVPSLHMTSDLSNETV